MELQKALILSDDGHLTHELGRLLREECDVVLSDGDPCVGLRPSGRVRWVFYDLRHEASWGRWMEGPHPARNDPSVRHVAVIRDGYPLEYAVSAHHFFDQSLTWPFRRAEVAGLRRADTPRAARRAVAPRPRVFGARAAPFVTYTPALGPVLDDLEAAAGHQCTILLLGETGTGKTTLARAVHELSPRAGGPFVTIACAAVRHELISSELYGHVKGAFTGAYTTKQGKFEAARGGTMLLDEIDVLGLDQQANLLRVLETGEFEPVGSNQTCRADVRTIVASNEDLDVLMEQGRFRADLYYRLAQMKFEIPPLRQRPLDIVPLAVRFVEECCQDEDLEVRSVAPDFLTTLQAYAWPGNIRELRNEVRRAVLFSNGGVLEASSLSPNLTDGSRSRTPNGHAPGGDLAADVAETERRLILRTLEQQDYNRAATARALGISRTTLYKKVRKYEIPVDR